MHTARDGGKEYGDEDYHDQSQSQSHSSLLDQESHQLQLAGIKHVEMHQEIYSEHHHSQRVDEESQVHSKLSDLLDQTQKDLHLINESMYS